MPFTSPEPPPAGVSREEVDGVRGHRGRLRAVPLAVLGVGLAAAVLRRLLGQMSLTTQHKNPVGQLL